ncbi:putative BURP domain-containing protein 17-like [Capsicum annuum]|nr:putative BURP domain-containing protein 17-like [Capsicum annuum]
MESMLLPNKKFKNQNRCVHPFCIDCIVKYISVKLEDNVVEIPCPYLSCNQFLDPICCRNLVGPELFVKWSDKLCESYVLGLTHCYCPNWNCSALILDECGGGNAKRSQCPNCKRFFCLQCKLSWHAGFKCEEGGELMDINDVAFGVLVERNKWKRCPNCRRFVSKTDGCKIVKCRCSANFCYECGRQVRIHLCGCGCDSPDSMIINCLGLAELLEVLDGRRHCEEHSSRFYEESGRFIYYFMAFGASIRGYAHMRKVVAVDGTHLLGKYKGVLLSVVTQDTQNHIYPLAYCVVDKENDESWGFFFEKLKAFVVDEPELCIISDRHAYTLEEFNDYFNALKERCPSAAACLEHEVGFEKWSRAHFPGNRFNIMTLNIAESLNSMLCDEGEYPVAAIFNLIAHKFGEIFRKRYAKVNNSKTTFVFVAETILRENMTERDKLYVNNINRSTDEFTVLGYGRSKKVYLSRRSCSCIKYDLMKLPCAHAMAALHLKHGDEYGTSIYNYSSQIYSKESYLIAYLEPICAAPLE